jgi:hypothetical protein
VSVKEPGVQNISEALLTMRELPPSKLESYGIG